MISTKVRFETGERAIDSGKYVCKAGISKAIMQHEKFPVCPISHRDTTWERMN
jgi:hypothetical protein